MSIIEQFLESVERFFYRQECKRIEAYLSEAQTVEELGCRIRVLHKDPTATRTSNGRFRRDPRARQSSILKTIS